jgi:hypothetical protein
VEESPPHLLGEEAETSLGFEPPKPITKRGRSSGSLEDPYVSSEGGEGPRPAKRLLSKRITTASAVDHSLFPVAPQLDQEPLCDPAHETAPPNGVTSNLRNAEVPDDLAYETAPPDGEASQLRNDEVPEDLAYETAPLDGATSYLHNDEVLNALGLRFHKHFKILICLECSFSYTPDELPTHLKRHKMKLTPEQKAYISSSPKTLGVRKEPGVKLLPTPCGPPVEGLLSQQGHRCKFCHYASVSSRTMMDHHSKAHKDTHPDIPVTSRSRKAVVQTFRQSTNRVYFEVQPALVNVPSTSAWGAFVKEEELKSAEDAELAAVPALRATEVPLLLKHTQWHTQLGDRIKDRKDRAVLLDMTALPTESDRGLGLLKNISAAYLKMAAQVGRDSDKYVLQMLQEFPVSVISSPLPPNE